MFNGHTFGLLSIIIGIATTTVTAKSKYYDGETRPYEFGYRIEGNQHRHEEKDTDGIINGEFGFIIGDGAYHQTVYATDENGNFKLISLKSSFRIEKLTTTTAPPTTTPPPAPISHAPQSIKLLKSCSDCRVFEQVLTSVDSNVANHDGPAGNKASPQITEKNQHDNAKTSNKTPLSHPTSKPVHSAQVAIPVSLQTKSEITVPIPTDYITNKPVQSSKTHLSSKKAINDFIGDVLYRFNYTAGYHGHNEEGDTASNKRGSYFIVGRDNIRRGVIYVANENGFVPMVKYEKVSAAEAPHEDTEKSAGLRGYEFEWFHKGKSKVDSLNEKGR